MPKVSLLQITSPLAARKGNAAFDIIRQGGIWKWIEPKEFIDTNWADRGGDGKDDYPDPMPATHGSLISGDKLGQGLGLAWAVLGRKPQRQPA